MATFIPGLSRTFGPSPELRLNIDRVERMLRLRESMYQEGVKRTRNLYESAFNSTMLRDGNIKRRDDYLKVINDGLKAASAMDLSLPQNQNYANSLFQPVLEDADIIKDISFTKDYATKRSRLESFKESSDVDTRKRYWAEGVKYMDYQAEEFKNSSDDKARSMSNVEYVENVDVIPYVQKMFKESGISVTQDEKSGAYIYTRKNGDVVLPVAKEYVDLLLSQDPAVAAKLKVEAYVDRKDFIKTNAAAFGSEENAEKQYITNNLQVRQTAFEQQLDGNIKKLEGLKTQKNSIIALKQKNNGTLTADQEQMLLSTNELIGQYEQIVQNQKDQIANTKSFDFNNLNDARTLVDVYRIATSYSSMVETIASVLSHKDAELKMKIDPIFQMEYRAQLQYNNAVNLEAIRQGNRLNAIQQRAYWSNYYGDNGDGDDGSGGGAPGGGDGGGGTPVIDPDL